MTFSDETVMAYADGELDDATSTALEFAMATDPDLAERVSRERKLRTRLHGEFDPVLREPIPEQLLAAAHGTPAKAGSNVVPLKRSPIANWSWLQWGAIAASLVLGLLLAPRWRHEPTSGPLGIHDGEIFASGALAHALSQQLASNQTADAPVHVGVSFLSHDGNYCRTFMLRDKSAITGLACRDGAGWRLEALEATRQATSGSGAYQPAASSLPRVIEQSVADLIVGDPLDAKAEEMARGHDWHP